MSFLHSFKGELSGEAATGEEMSAAMYVLSALGGYVLSSALLFRCPGLLHKKQKQSFRSRHISHRGGAGENLENTMAAFRHAVQLGTEMLELDCHITKDGQVVVSHDDNLKRTTGVDVDIADLTFAVTPPPYHCRLHVSFKKDSFCVGGEERKIPLLRDVFEAFPKIPINIDIKVNNDALIEKVSDLVKEFNRQDITVWGNTSNNIVKKCYKVNPNIPILFSLQRVLLLLGLFYTGLLPFFPIREQFLEIPMPSIMLKLKDSKKISRIYRFMIWLADTLLMRKSLFEHLKARGIQIYIWVLNDEEDFKRAFELGVTGVMTDYPTQLKKFLEHYPCRDQ
ncbi:lysophospholipase D GDPD1 [Stegostoma tigrinum]|uniref:lysophospholipase D GDPD1 n=1 Tax=Stegostoma tigrinum TaxID=3053191 RepID=UPI00286FEDE3|nr:lysophospholipase D GDPD1 [Stegostoma tigrinum]